MCVRFSLQIGFLYINKHVCKQICPVGLQGQKDWIHVPSKPLLGVRRGGVYTRFALGFVCLILPPPCFFSYLVLVLSPSRLQTHMSCNSSLESQAFVKRASTENRLLWLRKPIKKSQGSKLKKSLGQLLATNWRNIVARCKFLVASLHNVNDAAW